jgi:hypothetical protein
MKNRRIKELEMRKNKSVLIISAALFFIMGAYFFVQMPKAQTASFESADSEILAGKIDRLSADIDKTNKEISKKIDQVLSNQAAIMQELEIVKIRATRSR